MKIKKIEYYLENSTTKVITLLLLFSSIGIAKAQISNPSFETLVVASDPPTNTSQLDKAKDWSQPTGGNPDYFNNIGRATPLNGAGITVIPKNGSYYIGLYLESAALENNSTTAKSNYKEYATNTLSSTLQAGTKYIITFWVNRLHMNNTTIGQGYNYLGNYVPLPREERGYLGLCFSNTPPTSNNTSKVGVLTPKAWSEDPGNGGIFNAWNPTKRVTIPSTNTAVYESANTWTQVSLEYTADGTEKYMTLGQWRESPTTLTKTDFGTHSYYFFDDFKIVAACNAGSTAPILH